VASIGVFWAGITLPLAAAGAVTGWRVRNTGDRAQLATIAVALSALAAVALVAVIVGDAVANGRSPKASRLAGSAIEPRHSAQFDAFIRR